MALPIRLFWRLLLALVGGFVLSAQFAVLVPYYLPNLLNSTIASFLLAIVFYPLLILWALASQHLVRLTCLFGGGILLAWWAIRLNGGGQ